MASSPVIMPITVSNFGPSSLVIHGVTPSSIIIIAITIRDFRAGSLKLSIVCLTVSAVLGSLSLVFITAAFIRLDVFNVGVSGATAPAVFHLVWLVGEGHGSLATKVCGY